MSIERYYYSENDLVRTEAAYKVVKWVYDDPDRAIDVASTLISVGFAILGLAWLAKAFKE